MEKETSIEEQIQQIFSEKEKIIASITALEEAGIEAPGVLLNQIALLEKKEKGIRKEETMNNIKRDISFLAEKYAGVEDLVFAVRIKADGTIAVSGKSTGTGGDGGGKRSKYSIIIGGKPYKSWAEAAREFNLFKPNTNLRPVVKKYLDAEGIEYTEEVVS